MSYGHLAVTNIVAYHIREGGGESLARRKEKKGVSSSTRVPCHPLARDAGEDEAKKLPCRSRREIAFLIFYLRSTGLV